MEPFHVGAKMLSVFKKAHAPFKSFQQVRKLIVRLTKWVVAYYVFLHYNQFFQLFGFDVALLGCWKYLLLSLFRISIFLYQIKYSCPCSLY